MALTDRRCFYCQSTDPEHNGVCCRCEHSGRSHEDWARGEGDQPAAETHPFRRPTHGRVLADFDKCGAVVVGGKRCWQQSSDPIHNGEGDRPPAGLRVVRAEDPMPADLPEYVPDFCQHEDCDQPPTCWVTYYSPEGEVIGAIFTCDPHQAEYIAAEGGPADA